MNVNPDRFTELGITAIQQMAEVAKRNGQQEVDVWHLLDHPDEPGKWNRSRIDGGNGCGYCPRSTRFAA